MKYLLEYVRDCHGYAIRKRKPLIRGEKLPLLRFAVFDANEPHHLCHEARTALDAEAWAKKQKGGAQ